MINKFKKIFFKLIPEKDEFLEDIKENHIAYQNYLNKIIREVDDDVYARWVNGTKELNRGEVDRENKILYKTLDDAFNKGLSSTFLLTMFFQYSTADLYFRDREKNRWVQVVLNRKKIDSFPDHRAILHILDEEGMLDGDE